MQNFLRVKNKNHISCLFHVSCISFRIINNFFIYLKRFVFQVGADNSLETSYKRHHLLQCAQSPTQTFFSISGHTSPHPFLPLSFSFDFLLLFILARISPDLQSSELNIATTPQRTHYLVQTQQVGELIRSWNLLFSLRPT